LLRHVNHSLDTSAEALDLPQRARKNERLNH
jgi:hypothetical protein